MRMLQDKIDNALVVKIHQDAHMLLWIYSLLHRVENMLSMDNPSGSLHSLGFVTAYWNTLYHRDEYIVFSVQTLALWNMWGHISP